jgi:uncharacterized protein YqjF (DUF2071 family)
MAVIVSWSGVAASEGGAVLPVRPGPWVIAQTWSDLLFAHWRVPPESLRLPSGLELDTFEGEAYLGVVPFAISGHRPRATPALPRLSRFPELNVRTYVKGNGVWFFSLDAASMTAVRLARRTYFLPYYKAEMAIASGERIEYRSRRPGAEFRATYAPTGPVRRAEPGTLDHWLTERYCLYARHPRGRLLRADIAHVPWPLQPASASIEVNTMAPAGVELPDEAPLLHFARRIDVHIWPPRRVTRVDSAVPKRGRDPV